MGFDASNNITGLGAYILHERQVQDISIEKLAEKSGTSYIFISHLERGMLNSFQLTKLLAVLEALGLSLILTPVKKALS